MQLKIENICKQYQRQPALQSVSTILKDGVYGILGPNGAGKTTLINIIIGAIKQTKGEIYFNGTAIEKMKKEYFSQIGYLPQYPIFYKNFSGREFLEYMCALKDIPKSEGEKCIEELIEMVNLKEDIDRKIGTYSGGMRQRIGIVQAMLNDPAILILDEPTAGLDPKERISFRNIISKLSKERIVLLATHIVSDIEYIANEVILLKKGKIIQQDTPINLIEGIKDFVWELKVDENSVNIYMDKYTISNVQNQEKGYTLRIISKQKPHPTAILIQPHLEDTFLFYCLGEN